MAKQKQFTAEEMREMAAEAEVIEVADQFYGHNMDTIAAMLRQAADAMEREEREQKYEYAECYFTSSISTLHESSEDDVRLYASNGSTVVRRTVGEWEHLPRRCGE